MPDPEVIAEEQIDYSFLTHPVVIAVTIARFLAAVYILVDPLWGLVLSLTFDVLDYQVLARTIHIKREEYHFWDKNVDWIAYVTELWVGVQYGAFLPLFLLLFYRFMGQYMFVRSHRRLFFIIFPNFYENVFLWIILFHQRFQVLTWPPAPLGWLIILLILKVVHELGLHFVLPKLETRPAFQKLQAAFYQEKHS